MNTAMLPKKPTGEFYSVADIIGTGTSPEAAMMNLASNLQDAGIDARITTKSRENP